MATIRILPTPHGSRILAEDIHTAWHLDVPINLDDLHTLIQAAFKSPDDQLRSELQGVFADRTETGVRVRVVANTSHFDIPWPNLARGIK